MPSPLVDRRGQPLRRPAVITDWHVKAIRKQIAGDIGGAMALWAKILERNAHDPKALYFMALAYYSIHELERAIAYMRACLHEAPTHADAWFNLAKFLQDAGKPDEALKHYIAALEYEPTKVEALTNAGNLFYQFGDIESALSCHHQAIAQDPSTPEARYNRSFIQLLHGDYPHGWADYESRWRCRVFQNDYERAFMREIPRWPLGDTLDGKQLLLHAEQGHGDALMMLRYVPLFIEADKAITLEVHGSLVPLCSALFPEVITIAREEYGKERQSGQLHKAADVQLPMMSLPFQFGTTLDTLPPAMPSRYVERLGAPVRCSCSLLHVALCWAGSSTHPNDADRSAPPGTFAPLLEIPGIHWTSLQVGERVDEYELDHPALPDYLATAQVIRAQDLVITVDTSVAHLAGMFAREVWIAVPSLPEFRWLLDRRDSPLYANARLWRREPGHGWRQMMHAMEAQLRTDVELLCLTV